MSSKFVAILQIMPSGPKKRRAARNKKQKENININLSSTNNPLQGNGDLKSKNEKGSDGGEYNSHTSAARPIASEVMSVEEVFSDVKIEQALSGKQDCLAMVDRDLTSKDCYERENGRFEHIETAKESCLESGNRGGISNGESLAEKNSKDDEFVKSNDSLPSNADEVKMNLPVEQETGGKSAAEDSINSGKTAASVSEVEKGNTQSVFLENSVAPLQKVIDLAGKMNEDSVYPSTDENAKTSSFEEPKFTNVVVHTKNSETPKSSKNQPSVSLAPNLVKTTSWLSCCGMFEILSGSNR